MSKSHLESPLTTTTTRTRGAGKAIDKARADGLPSRRRKSGYFRRPGHSVLPAIQRSPCGPGPCVAGEPTSSRGSHHAANTPPDRLSAGRAGRRVRAPGRGRATRVGTGPRGFPEREQRRVAELQRRRQGQQVFAARSDRRLQLQQARDRLAAEDRQPRSAPRVQARRHAAHGQGRRLRDRPARADRSWRSTPGPES